VNVFRHHDIPDDHEPMALASLFQNRKEGIAAAHAAQKRQSPVARASDKVQVMSAVGAMQAAGHNKLHGTGSIVPALAKNARAGHPRFRNGKGKHEKPGHPPVIVSYLLDEAGRVRVNEGWGKISFRDRVA
jgi:hypothetical protein